MSCRGCDCDCNVRHERDKFEEQLDNMRQLVAELVQGSEARLSDTIDITDGVKVSFRVLEEMTRTIVLLEIIEKGLYNEN